MLFELHEILSQISDMYSVPNHCFGQICMLSEAAIAMFARACSGEWMGLK